MKAKPVVFLVLTLLLAAGCYFLGVRDGMKRRSQMLDTQQQISTAQFCLINYLKIDNDLRNNDLLKAREDLGMLILIRTRDYEQNFGPPAQSDRFAEAFEMAQAIADQVQSSLVPLESAFKAVGPNTTVTVKEQ